MKAQHPILYFDGVCNLCNTTVLWILKRDKKSVFRFASLQSDAGKALLASRMPGQSDIGNSVLLEVDGKVYAKSAAIIHTVKMLGGFYKLAVIAWLVPRFVRDAIYDYVAKNRYKWYGKKDACMVPTPELKARFLD